jgi:drug/metabolite transporter (DMT)-like permease
MNRQVGWRRIMVAVLIGCAVFAGAKFAYGFQISIPDIIGIVISLAVVFGLASVILVFRDRVMLKPNMSADEREAVITRRSNRLHRGWAIAIFVMALVALPVHAFGLEDEPLWQRLLYSGLAALIVINVLLIWHDSHRQTRGRGNRQAKRATTRNEKSPSHS